MINNNAPILTLDANPNFAGKNLKVTVTYKDEKVVTETALNITNATLPDQRPPVVEPPKPVVPPTPAPVPPQPQPEPLPPSPVVPPKPTLKNVDIELDKNSYVVGNTIVANATINPNDVENVSYQWEIIGGHRLSNNGSSIRFEATESLINKTLKVTATANGVSVSNTVLLNITKPLPQKDFDISHASITIDKNNYEYTGKQISPVVNVVANGETLVNDKDYQITLGSNTNVGTASVTIKGIGQYHGTITKTFNIVKATNIISGFRIENNEPIANAKFGNVMFEYYEDAACTIKVPGNAPSQTKTYWVKAISESSSNYQGTVEGPIAFNYQLPDVLKLDLSAAQITVIDKSFDYNGSYFQPRIQVTYKNKVLEEGKDYTVGYTNNQLPGTGTITIYAGINSDYKGTKSANFAINKVANKISNFKVVGNTPIADALDGGVSFKYYTDPLCQHEIDPSEVNEIRPYWVKAVSQDTLTHFSVTTSEAIRFDYREGNDYWKSNIADADVEFLSSDLMQYNGGNAITPAFSAYINGVQLRPGVDFEFEYQNNFNVGTAQLVLRALDKSDYYGSVNVSFEIEKAPNRINDFTTINGYPQATALEGAVSFSYYLDRECQRFVSDTLPTTDGDYWVVATSVDTNNYYSETTLPTLLHLRHNSLKTQLNQQDVTLTSDQFIFDGTYHTPTVKVIHNGVQLVNGTDYYVEYFNNKNAGTATYAVVGIGAYTGTITGNFYINKANNNIANVNVINGKLEVLTNENSNIKIEYFKDEACTQKVSGTPTVAGTYYVMASVGETTNYKACSAVQKVYFDGNNATFKDSQTDNNKAIIFYSVVGALAAIIVILATAGIVRRIKRR